MVVKVPTERVFCVIGWRYLQFPEPREVAEVTCSNHRDLVTRQVSEDKKGEQSSQHRSTEPFVVNAICQLSRYPLALCLSWKQVNNLHKIVRNSWPSKQHKYVSDDKNERNTERRRRSWSWTISMTHCAVSCHLRSPPRPSRLRDWNELNWSIRIR